eukprot:4448611-Amphidinium_carterae.1
MHIGQVTSTKLNHCTGKLSWKTYTAVQAWIGSVAEHVALAGSAWSLRALALSAPMWVDITQDNTAPTLLQANLSHVPEDKPNHVVLSHLRGWEDNNLVA